jgi:hypothetical protein
MPLTKADYSKTIIYKIQHKEIDELIYVGSTTDFTRRKAGHKRRCNNTNDKRHNLKVYQMIRDNGGWDMFNILVIKEYPCNNKREAEAEEDKVIREARANMNSLRAYVSREERLEQKRDNHYHYYLENKEQILERMKHYYLENKGKIAEREKQKITCDCGCVLRRCCLARHKRTKKHQDSLNITEQY